MLPGRPSDSGPDSRTYCPSCGSSKWAVLADCHDCGKPICSECPGAAVDTAGMRTKIRCHDCEIDRQRELYTVYVAKDTWPGARLVKAQKLYHCQYQTGQRICRRAIMPGDRYIDPGESNPENAGGFGGFRYCLAHFQEASDAR